MSSHNLRRIITLSTHQILRVPILRSPYTAIAQSASISSKTALLRFYSQQASEIMPVVEFDYVKRATANNDVIIIDVREPDEVKEHGKIPNSINIPLGTITETLSMSEQDFQKIYNKSKPKENSELIFYCMIGKRSAKAQQSAQNLGYKNAKNYLGSWTDWAVKVQ